MEGGFKCKLSLPPIAPVQDIVGPLSRNTNLAKQLACLEACKELHKRGALDNHLQPLVEDPMEQDHPVKSKKRSSSGAAGINFVLNNMLSLLIIVLNICFRYFIVLF